MCYLFDYFYKGNGMVDLIHCCHSALCVAKGDIDDSTIYDLW